MAAILGNRSLDNLHILKTDVSPATGGGTTAILGSFATAADGSGFFLKTGALATAWTRVATTTDLALYVPYTGATATVDLGTHPVLATSPVFKTNLIVDDYVNNEPQIIARISGSTTDQAIFGKVTNDEYYLYTGQNVGYSFYANNIRTLTSSKSGQFAFANQMVTSGATIGFDFQGSADTNQTAGANINRIRFSTFTRQWATGAIPLQYEFQVNQPGYSAVAASTMAFAANFAILGPPKANANITITDTVGHYVSTNSLASGGSVTNGWGMWVESPTAATNNYSAKFKLGASGASPFLGAGINLVLESNTTNYLTFLQPDANIGGFVFGSPSDSFGAFIRWGYSTSKMQIATASSGHSIEFLTANSVSAMTLDSSQNMSLVGNATLKHLIGGSTAPTIAAGTGAGTGPTVSVSNATDLSGIINVTTGALPTAAATVVTITFNVGYGVAPNIQLFPGNAETALLSGVTMVFVTSTTTTFVITAGSTGLVAATAYKWYYIATQ